MEFEIKTIKVGDIIEGEVVQIDDNEILVDFGYMTEGVIYLNELTLSNAKKCTDIVQLGDQIAAMVKKLDDEEVLLSRKILELREANERVQQLHDAHEVVTGRVIESVKGGYIVNIGVKAFMPNSQVDMNREFDGTSLIGKEVEVLVIEFNKRKNRIIVSRRQVQYETFAANKKAEFEKLAVGDVVEGTVKKIEEFGAIVKLEFNEGLIHNSEVSHYAFTKVSDELEVGEKVQVKIIKVDTKRNRLGLSLKALKPTPWQMADEQFENGQTYKGKVTKIADFGFFVELAPSVEGLVHRSEVTYNNNVNFKDVIKEGQEIEVRVLEINADKERLSLSLKQTKENPWHALEIKERDIIKGKVVSFNDSGANVEIAEDVVGFLPNSQISEKRVNKAEEVLTVGQEIEVKVMNINKYQHKLVLSIRRIKQDEERAEVDKFLKEQDKYEETTFADVIGDKLKDLFN